jgi:hypothetical protein
VLRSWPDRTEAMQDAVSVLLRIFLPLCTRVNEGKRKGQGYYAPALTTLAATRPS